MSASDVAGARSAPQNRTLVYAISAWLALAPALCASAQSVDRPSKQVVTGHYSEAGNRVVPPPARSAALERFAAYKLGRIGRQAENVGDAEQPLPPVTPMESLDLRVPDLSELSTASEAERVEIPDYARAVFAGLPTTTIAEGGERGWTSQTFPWEASGLYHRPLYFEDVNLERHGHSLGLAQPAVSAGLALGQLVALPYQMVAEPPCECIYTLGEARPGNCVPCQLVLPPLSLPAGAAEAGVVAGLILLIP